MYIFAMTVCNRIESGGINHLDTTIASLRASGLWDSGIDFVLLLHDTGSKDQSYLDKYVGQENCIVVKPKEKLGQQDNMVAMLQYANDNLGGSKDDYVLFLEDDILFCDNFISNLDVWVKKHVVDEDIFQSFYVPYTQSQENIAKGIDEQFLLRHFYGAQALGFKYHRLSSLLAWLKMSRSSNGKWTALNDLLIRAWVETFGKPTMKVSAPPLTQHLNTGSSLHTPTHQAPNFTGKDPCFFSEGITVFSVPKPFNDKYKIIQRNAIQSWLKAGCSVILFGDEIGVAETAKEFGLRHIKNLEKSPQGTPYLDGVFFKANRAAGTRLLCYCNADMVFPDNLSEIYKLIKFDKFLMVGNRHGVDQTAPIDFENKNWYPEMLARSKQKDGCFLDYFCYPKALQFTMPQFILGRPLWDQWLLHHFAEVLKLPILNVNESFKALHQNHDYQHIEKGSSTGGAPWTGPECDHNYKLFGNTPLKQIGDCTTHVLCGSEFVEGKGTKNAIFDFDKSLLDDFISGETLQGQCSDHWRPRWGDGSISWATLRDGSSVFCKMESIQEFFAWARQAPQLKFRVVSHNSDYPIDESRIATKPENIKIWFGQNSTVEHPNVVPVPIGLANSYCKGLVRAEDIKAVDTKRTRTKLLYVNFRTGSNTAERLPLMDSFLKRSGTWFSVGTDCLQRSSTDQDNAVRYLKEMTEHKFVLCPAGNGVDTHRLWEALYSKTIPVVRYEPAYRNFMDLPILFVKDWSEVTEEFLNRKYAEMSAKKWNFSKLKASWWGQLFRGERVLLPPAPVPDPAPAEECHCEILPKSDFKIEKVVMSCDSNPLYLDFWPIVSQVWKQKFGIEPILLFFGDKTSHKLSEEFGKVVEFPILPDVPIHLQTLWARYWYTQTEPETVFTVSDIDMVPLSKFYFVEQIKNLPSDSYAHINPDPLINSPLSTCYHIAKGKVFKDILSLDDKWDQSVRFLHNLKIGSDLGNGCKDWFADERYVGSKIRAKKGSDSRIIFIQRDGGERGHRIDRGAWKFDLQAIREEQYYDCHCPRPFKDYEKDIRRIVDAALPENRVLIMVLAGGPESFQRMTKAVKETWASIPSACPIVFTVGNTRSVDFNGQDSVLIGDTLHNNCEDGQFSHVLKQTLMSLQYVLAHYDFTHVFRCNTGSYVNVEKLLEFIKDKPVWKFYSGPEGNWNGLRYAGGSGVWLSRDLVQLLVKNKDVILEQAVSGWDDIEVGRFLSDQNIQYSHAWKKQDIRDDQDIENLDLTQYHYHVNHDQHHCPADARDAVRVPRMFRIHQVVQKARQKLLVLVLSGGGESYQRLAQSVRETWASNPEVPVLYTKCDPGSIEFGGQNTVQVGDILYNRVDEIYHVTDITQTLMSFEYLLKHYDFTHIFRTNVGSYLNIPLFLKFLSENPNYGCYAGVVTEYLKGSSKVTFASGAGLLLSRDVIELLLKNKDDILRHRTEWDDVEIARCLSANNVPLLPARRQDVGISDTVDLTQYHYRILYDPRGHGQNHGNDAERIPIMWRVHNAVCQARGIVQNRRHIRLVIAYDEMGPYQRNLEQLRATYQFAGIDSIQTYSKMDILACLSDEERQFIQDNPTGFGCWAWKPAVIMDQMKKLGDGDVVFYHDAGRGCYDYKFTGDVRAYVQRVIGSCSGVGVSALPLQYQHKEWTKRDCFTLMGCDTEEYWDLPQISANFSVWEKSELSLRVLAEWRRYCFSHAGNDAPSTAPNFPFFQEHRRDQSILTNLLKKHGLKSHPPEWCSNAVTGALRIVNMRYIMRPL